MGHDATSTDTVRPGPPGLDPPPGEPPPPQDPPPAGSRWSWADRREARTVTLAAFSHTRSTTAGSAQQRAARPGPRDGNLSPQGWGAVRLNREGAAQTEIGVSHNFVG